MSSLLIGVFVFILLALIGILILVVGIYNALLAVKENVNKSWANIDVILKQRYDEIPQLIKICEQYVEFEQGIVDKVMNAREKMIQGHSIKDKAEASGALTAGIHGLLAVGESYPDLKANSNFLQIQERLTRLEETLADRREFYNDCVNILNTRIQQIPDVFLAGLIGLTRKEMFEVSETERRLPDLNIRFKR